MVEVGLWCGVCDRECGRIVMVLVRYEEGKGTGSEAEEQETDEFGGGTMDTVR